jgi:26S proteasome regulatory subunit N5
MDRREKVEFILYQMKIQLKKRDLIRLAIVSRKINTKNLNEPNIIDLKIVYYTYMVALNIHDQKYIDTAKSY